VSAFITCRIVGLAIQLQGQLFSATRTKVLKPNVDVAVIAVPVKVDLAYGCATPFT